MIAKKSMRTVISVSVLTSLSLTNLPANLAAAEFSPSTDQSGAAQSIAAQKSGGVNFTPNFPQPSITDAHLEEAIRLVDKLAQKEVDENLVPGLAVAIVHKDKLVFARGYGVRVIGKPEKVDADTVFQLASVSKPLASTVISKVVGEGKLSWDSKISDLDPAFSMHDPWVTREITVRDLFSHRSGLPDHAGDALEDIGFDRSEVLHRLRFQRPDTSFRSGYAYTNFGLTEAAVAAAKACNSSWEDLSYEKLYAPLGMTSTSSRYSDFDGRDNKARGHVMVDGKWVQKYMRQPDAQSPAGGASSSVNDMAKWMRLQLAGGKFDGKLVVSEAALAETHHPQMLIKFSPLDGRPEFYGLGFNVSYDQSGYLQLGHSGGFDAGASTCMRMVPDETLGICVLTNACPIGVAEGLAADFMDMARYGKQSQDWLTLFKQIFASGAAQEAAKHERFKHPSALPTAALKNGAYTGVYQNDYLGKVEIVELNDGLAMIQGPKKFSFPLKHYDRDTFTYVAEGEYTSGTSGLRFSIGSNGKATNVLLENLEESGNGLLTRVSK